MSTQEVEQDLAEGNFLFFASHHVRNIIHSDPHGVSETLLQRLGRARPSDDVLARMNHQCRRLDITEVRPNIVPPTGLHKRKWV